jgi:hypothetical protein
MGGPLSGGGWQESTVNYLSDANVRVNKFAAMVKSVLNPSNTPSRLYAALPAGANAPGFIGVLLKHFFEPNYYVPEGTVSTTITGTVPALIFNLQGKPMVLKITGVARFICASAVNQGAELIIADRFGRVQTNNVASGSVANVVGIAEHSTQSAEDIVQGLIQPYSRKM